MTFSCPYGTEGNPDKPDPIIYQGDLTSLYSKLKEAGSDPSKALKDYLGGGVGESSDDLTKILGTPRNLVPIWAQTRDSFCAVPPDSEFVPEVGTDTARAVAFNHLVRRKWQETCRCKQPPKQGACVGVEYEIWHQSIQSGISYGVDYVDRHRFFGPLELFGGRPQPGTGGRFEEFAIIAHDAAGGLFQVFGNGGLPPGTVGSDPYWTRVIRRLFRLDGRADNCAVDTSSPPPPTPPALPEPSQCYYFAPAVFVPRPPLLTPEDISPVLTPPPAEAPPTGLPNPPCVCPPVSPPLPAPPVKEIVKVIVPGTPGKDGATGPQGVQGLKGDKGDPAMVDFSKIPIPILDCLEPGSAKIVEDVVDVISGALGSEAKLIGLLFNEILRIRQAQCDEEPSVDTPSVIASGTSLEGDQVSVVPITNQDSRLFALVLKPPFPNSVRLYQLGGATQTEGNFGTASLAYQVGTTSYTAVHGSPLNVATPATLIAVPNLPLQAYIRISLKVGVSWELWDMGLRQAQPSLPAA